MGLFSEFVIILVENSYFSCLEECLFDIVILPCFARSFTPALEVILLLLLQLLLRHRHLIARIHPQVTLRAHQNNRCVRAYWPYFSLPFGYVIEGVAVGDWDTEHEAVCLVVADLSIGAKVIVAGSIVNFQSERLLVVGHWAFEDVQDTRLVIFIENLSHIIDDQAGLTHCSVADEYYLDRFGASMSLPWNIIFAITTATW